MQKPFLLVRNNNHVSQMTSELPVFLDFSAKHPTYSISSQIVLAPGIGIKSFM